MSEISEPNRSSSLPKLLLVLAMLLTGFSCILFTANRAMRLEERKIVRANMLSELNPDAQFSSFEITPVPRLRRELLTPEPAIEDILTPFGTRTVADQLHFADTPTPTPTPTPT
ncbi:MAG: hypothetical protein ACLFU8_14900, partial [Anaerolineales bacterium]